MIRYNFKKGLTYGPFKFDKIRFIGIIALLLGVIAMKPAIPYVDNIEDKFCRRNDILWR